MVRIRILDTDIPGMLMTEMRLASSYSEDYVLEHESGYFEEPMTAWWVGKLGSWKKQSKNRQIDTSNGVLCGEGVFASSRDLVLLLDPVIRAICSLSRFRHPGSCSMRIAIFRSVVQNFLRVSIALLSSAFLYNVLRSCQTHAVQTTLSSEINSPSTVQSFETYRGILLRTTFM